MFFHVTSRQATTTKLYQESPATSVGISGWNGTGLVIVWFNIGQVEYFQECYRDINKLS